MSFWGLSTQGKDAQQELTTMPKRFQERGAKDWERGDSEFDTGQGLRNEFLAYIREMIANGIGNPEEILALAEQVMPGVSEAIGRRNQRTDTLRTRAGELIPSGWDTAAQMSGTVDEYGRSILNDRDMADSDIRDTFGRQTQRADQFGKDRVSNIGDVYGGLNKFTNEQQAGMTGDVEGTYGRLTKGVSDTFDPLLSELDPAYAEMQKRVEAFKPGGEARAARVGRSFNPAYASTVSRLRRGGVDLTSPEAVTALGRIDTARANSMDDSLGDDTERYVSASNQLGLSKLGNKQNLAIGSLDRTTNLGTNRLNTSLDLQSRFGDVMRQLGLGQGKDFRDELTRQEETGRGLDLSRLNMNTDLISRTGDRLDNYFGQRMSIPQIARQLGMQDFEVQAMLEDRANNDDLTAFDLKNAQFDRGLNFRTQDLNRKDAGAQAVGSTGRDAMNGALNWNSAGGRNMENAAGGYQDVFNRESANAGWGKKLLGAAGGAAADYFLPGSGSIVRSATGGGGGGGSSVNPFSSFGNLLKNRNNGGAANLPYKTGSPINPYGGIQNPRFFAEGGVVDDPTMAVLGEAGEREYVVPESKANAFSIDTLNMGQPPDPATLMSADPLMEAASVKPPVQVPKIHLRKIDDAIKRQKTVTKDWLDRLKEATSMAEYDMEGGMDIFDKDKMDAYREYTTSANMLKTLMQSRDKLSKVGLENVVRDVNIQMPDAIYTDSLLKAVRGGRGVGERDWQERRRERALRQLQTPTETDVLLGSPGYREAGGGYVGLPLGGPQPIPDGLR